MFTKNESRARAKNEQSELITFQFSENKSIVRNLLIDGEPWFVAMDVCGVLGLTDTNKAIQPLEDDEKLTRKLFASGQNRKMWMINESGLYALILRSNKPNAKVFRKWVTGEVLPALRKRGYYGVNQARGREKFIDARDIPCEVTHVNKFPVRCIELDGEKWIPINDVNKAIRSSTESSQSARQLNARRTLAIKIWLFGNTHPAWCTNELGVRLLLSGSRKLRYADQLTLENFA